MKKLLILVLLVLISCTTLELDLYPSKLNKGTTQERREVFVTKYGDNFGRKIARYEICKGMTKQMVVESWGRPYSISFKKRKDRDSEFEIWVYKDRRTDLIFNCDKHILEAIHKWKK